jgi:hypothetical protein
VTGRIRKVGLGAVLVGGTLLFAVGFAGAQSPSGGDGTPPPKAAHTSADDVMIGGSAGHGGCGGDGGATAAVASSIDL